MRSILLVFTIALISFSASATDCFSVTQGKSNVFHISYHGKVKGRVTVTILNAYNKKVFKETLSNIRSFERPYDFSGLPSGKYRLILKGQHTEQVETIEVVSARSIGVTSSRRSTKRVAR